MVGGGEVGMEVPVVALAARMTRWAVGGRRSHPFVFLSISRWAATTGQRFGCVQPGRGVCKDVCETHVVLWGRRGRLWQIHVCPSLEPDARALVRAKGEWGREDSRRFDKNGMEESQDVVEIV